MRALMPIILVASSLCGLAPSPALAQAASGGRGECDEGLVSPRPDCLGHNPYYAPLPANQPTDRDIQKLAQAMHSAAKAAQARANLGAKSDDSTTAGARADAGSNCRVIRVVYGGYGEASCTTR